MQIVNIICSDGISGHEKPILELQSLYLSKKFNTNFFFITNNKKIKKIFIRKKIPYKNINIIYHTNYYNLFKIIFNIIKSNNNSLFHSHLTKADIICSLIKTLYDRKIKLITTRPFDYSFNFKSRMFYSFIYKYFSNFDFQICISKNIENLIHKLENFDTKKSCIIEYGLNSNNRKFILKKNKKYINIVMVGRLITWKNHSIIFKYLNDPNFFNFVKRNNIKFIIYGDGPLYNHYRNEIKKLDFGDLISLKKNVINTEDIYTQADILLHPSIFEGYGLVAIEAMSFSKPVICNIGLGMSSSIKKISKYLVVDINSKESLTNAIIYTLKNYYLLSKKSYNYFINNHSIKLMSENYINIYEKIKNK